MRLSIIVYATLAVCLTTQAAGHNIICFYDASSEDRQGLARFTVSDLDMALDFCTHLIYGYAGINSDSLQLTSLNAERDIARRHFNKITDLKDKYPHIKFLLSVGGDKDKANSEKYLQLLEADREQQKVFIESVLYLIRSYKFDGLDLAYQFPHINNPIEDEIAQTWKSLNKFFIKRTSATHDTPDIEHKALFTNLVQDLKTAFKPHDLLLSLTVLPNINASMYFNASALATNLDFINLQTFDFTTPLLNPEEATYTAPLYPVHITGRRNLHYSVDFEINYWLDQHIPPAKLNVGIASYGRAWKMTLDSKSNGSPFVVATDGPALAGYLSKTPGILTWTEICSSLPNSFNYDKTGRGGPLVSVVDPHMTYVTYAYRPADSNGQHGLWVSYDDPAIAAAKAAYAKRRHLGGVALFDVSWDDFHGICNGDTFPMLRYIKYTFL